MDLSAKGYYNRYMKGVFNMSDMHAQVEEVLDKLRPFLQRDGGDCELVDFKDRKS